MKYCRYCGGEVSDNAKACGHCGRWLVAEADVPPAAEPVAPELPSGAETQEPVGFESQRTGPVTVAPGAVERGLPPPRTIRPQATSISPRRKRGIPVWAWPVAGFLMVLVVAPVVIATGGLNVAGQVPDVPTPTPAPTARPEPPAGEITILLGTDDVWKTLDAGQPVVVEWVWGVCDQTLIQENLYALTYKVTIDGDEVAVGSMAEYRTDLREEEHSGIRAWWQYYSFPIGVFESRSQHMLSLERGFTRQVTDGCDVDGDGNLDWYGPDTVFTSSLQLMFR
jgi:hypothetical protein